ncbi:SIMPL domain-containing protein [Alteromonas gilva]|uniref:SIMPL domain-containing protein n=1 Tax=Alteromonas gilva TaxID=2987522 RepID=A0ABT5L1W3_9ALTE|nr:SIMPL domain-containing protein [Alteromonas gilva]MDC8831035.1 SIMPL domain-containing protein [Alteromonas gilva]
MTQILPRSLTASILLGLSVFTSHMATANTNTLQVSGQGSVAQTPDAFTVTFVIEERGELVSKLNEQANAKLEAVVKFLLSAGIEKKHIQSMSVNLNPWFEHTGNGREQKGFVLSRQISVTSTALESYDSVLDGVMKRGVNNINQFQFIHLKPDEAYQQALIMAVKDAKNRARILASEVGVEIVGVVSVSEGSTRYQPPAGAPMRMMKEADSFSLPGESEISASVSVSFAIE